jgi:hypothetical protein
MRNDKRSERSIEDIQYFTDRFLSGWLDLPLRKLTRDMLEERHSLIGGVPTSRARVSPPVAAPSLPTRRCASAPW